MNYAFHGYDSKGQNKQKNSVKCYCQIQSLGQRCDISKIYTTFFLRLAYDKVSTTFR